MLTPVDTSRGDRFAVERLQFSHASYSWAGGAQRWGRRYQFSNMRALGVAHFDAGDEPHLHLALVIPDQRTHKLTVREYVHTHVQVFLCAVDELEMTSQVGGERIKSRN